MAQVVVTIKVMPASPDIDLGRLERDAAQEIKTFGSELGKVQVEPIAFGLKALKLMFVMDESRGSTESLEVAISRIEGVQSVDVVDVRRAIG